MLELLPVESVARVVAFNFAPKGCGVIHMASVAELVNQYIPNQFIG